MNLTFCSYCLLKNYFPLDSVSTSHFKQTLVAQPSYQRIEIMNLNCLYMHNKCIILIILSTVKLTGALMPICSCIPPIGYLSITM